MYSQLDVLRANELFSLAEETELKQETVWGKAQSNTLLSPAKSKRLCLPLNPKRLILSSFAVCRDVFHAYKVENVI